MASPKQKYIRYRTSTQIIHSEDDIDGDRAAPANGSIWTFGRKRYKVFKKDVTGGSVGNQIPWIEVFVEPLKEDS